MTISKFGETLVYLLNFEMQEIWKKKSEYLR